MLLDSRRGLADLGRRGTRDWSGSERRVPSGFEAIEVARSAGPADREGKLSEDGDDSWDGNGVERWDEVTLVLVYGWGLMKPLSAGLYGTYGSECTGNAAGACACVNGWKGGMVDVGGWRSGWFVGVMVVEEKWVFGDAYCSRPCS